MSLKLSYDKYNKWQNANMLNAFRDSFLPPEQNHLKGIFSHWLPSQDPFGCVNTFTIRFPANKKVWTIRISFTETNCYFIAFNTRTNIQYSCVSKCNSDISKMLSKMQPPNCGMSYRCSFANVIHLQISNIISKQIFLKRHHCNILMSRQDFMYSALEQDAAFWRYINYLYLFLLILICLCSSFMGDYIFNCLSHV